MSPSMHGLFEQDGDYTLIARERLEKIISVIRKPYVNRHGDIIMMVTEAGK